MPIFKSPTEKKLADGMSPETSKSRSKNNVRYASEPDRDMRGFRLDLDNMYTVWRSSTDVFGCVRVIRQTMGLGGVFLYDPKDPMKEKACSPADAQRLMDVMGYQYGGFRKFKNEATKHFLISANTFLEKVHNLDGEPLGLKVIDGRTIAIVSDEFGNVYRYIQTATGQFGAKGDSVVFESDEVIHWKGLDIDPDNDAWGMSPIENSLWEARTDLAAMLSNYFFFENDAVPAVQYILNDNIDPEDAKKITEAIKKQFKGPKNRHKSAVMGGVKEIKTIRISQKDMEYIVGRKFATSKICAGFGVPPVMLGYTEGVNYTNHEGQQENFYEGTVVEYEEAFAEMVNEEIIPWLGLEGRVGFRFRAATFEAKETLWNRAIEARKAGLIPIDEARALVAKDPIDPLVNGDIGKQLLFDVNPTPATDVGVNLAPENDALNMVKDTLTKAAKRNGGKEPSSR